MIFNEACIRVGLDKCMERELTDTDTKKSGKYFSVKLSDKLKNVSEKLYEAIDAFDKVKIIINSEICTTTNSKPSMKNLIGEVEKNQQKRMVRIKQLEKENCAKDIKLCHMADKIKKLLRDHEYDVLKINKQRKQLTRMEI